MPTLNNHPSDSIVKMLYIGNTGSGKTGSLASLVKAGYNLNILDFDNGLDILGKYLSAEEKSRVRFITCTDKLKTVAGKIIPDGAPVAFNKGMSALNDWVDGDLKLGPASSWGARDILVIDSMTMMSNSILRHVLFVNSRIGQDIRIQDWGQAMQLSEDLLALLYSDSIRCNVIVTSHISYIEQEGGITKGFPSALGNKLPPKVGRYFNTMLQAIRVNKDKQVIRTVPNGSIDLKTPIPGKLPEELPLQTGLATFFEAMVGKLPPAPIPSAA